MSTQELYFAISKKPRAIRQPSVVAFSFLLWGAIVTGCLVTDTIEFEDAINYPPETIEVFPKEHILTVCDNQTLIFWALIWDPDVEDPSESPAAANLSLIADTSQAASGSCNPASRPIIYSERGENKEGGTLVYLSCSTKLTEFNQNSLIEVTMTISDLGFISRANVGNPVPRPKANIITERWSLKVEDREICNQFR